MDTATRPIGSAVPLGRRLREDLRRRLLAHEWQPGERLPSESNLATDYRVSRVTVRTAVKALESQGLVDIRHGVGTFVCDFGTEIRAGLQELRSITETIREMGHQPQMELRKKEVRAATPDEVDKLRLSSEDSVLVLDRALLADGQAVAFSYDAVPIALLPASFMDEMGTGSVFADFERLGIKPVRARAELHPVQDPDIGWGSQRPARALYLLLDQVHYDRAARVVMYSKTYFIEGRFQFVILRTN